MFSTISFVLALQSSRVRIDSRKNDEEKLGLRSISMTSLIASAGICFANAENDIDKDFTRKEACTVSSLRSSSAVMG